MTDQRVRLAHPSYLHDIHADMTALAAPPVDPSLLHHRDDERPTSFEIVPPSSVRDDAQSTLA
jgi:hypothetical protein